MATIEAKSLEEGIQKVAEFLALEMQEQAKQNIVDYGAVDNGELLKSSDGTLRVQEGEVSFSFTVPYADNVEFGREAGSYPPYEPIYEWVVRNKARIGAEGDLSKIAQNIVYKIGNRGINPKPFLRDAIDMVVDRYKG